MARQFSTAVRNAMVAQYEATIGTLPILRTYTGAPPANCAAASSGTLLGEGTLPSDYLGAASAGAVAKSGTWTVTGQAGAGAGTAMGHFRIFDSAGTTCHDQGTITATGGGGDMTVDNVSIATGQVCTINTFTLTQGGA